MWGLYRYAPMLGGGGGVSPNQDSVYYDVYASVEIHISLSQDDTYVSTTEWTQYH